MIDSAWRTPCATVAVPVRGVGDGLARRLPVSPVLGRDAQVEVVVMVEVAALAHVAAPVRGAEVPHREGQLRMSPDGQIVIDDEGRCCRLRRVYSSVQ